ncbi:MAG: outer membrane protein assembly factor BamA [Verrucomicrobiota bacterium]|nr:outer membrane protein assembly factor BamA [Verrucomicrobiota bacterium]
MKFVVRRWTCFVLILCSLVTAYGQASQTIEKIEVRHIGPEAASESLIRGNIRIKEGDTYTRTSVDDDVRNLYATGLFYNIQVAMEPGEKGIKLVYVLQGKPVLSEINIEGNQKYSRKKILKKVSSKTGDPLDERKLFADAQEIQKMYQKSGYQRTEVKYVLNIEESAGRGSATFEIKEAPKIKIEDVQFIGAEAFKQRKLRKAIKTRRHWFLSWITGSGVLKDDQFQEDKETLADFYRQAGYIDFEIQDIKYDYVSPNKMIIRFFVDEGQQYKVGNVELKGNKEFKAEEIRNGIISVGTPIRMKMLEGETFTPKGLSEDIEAIRDFYGSRGYVDTWVRAIKNPNTERGTMDLVYQIMDEEKGKSFIEKIEIRGNTKTKDKVLRRELAVSPGETFDMVRVKRSKSILEQMQYFDKVETEKEDTDVPNRKNLIIDVEEGTTGHLELGAGFSSIDSLFGFVGYREGNFDLFNPPYFRGGGQKLRIGVTIGLRRKNYEISFTEPWFLGRRLALGVDLYHSELNYFSDVYDLTQTGGRLSLTRALPYNFSASVSYTLENISIDDVDPFEAPLVIQQEEGSTLVSKVGAGITYDTRNNAVSPSRGQKTELLTELAGGPLGAEADFYKLELRTFWYFPGFWEGHTWEIIGKSGVVEAYDDSPRVHLFDRFFLGGVTSLRGYRYRTVGPHEQAPNGNFEPVGGNTFWMGSVEYSIPIIERLKFALFYDIGNVYADSYDYDFSEYSDNWGVGIRLNIPRLGPLRLDYGIPIRHDDRFTSDSGKFQFSVGFTRDY